MAWIYLYLIFLASLAGLAPGLSFQKILSKGLDGATSYSDFDLVKEVEPKFESPEHVRFVLCRTPMKTKTIIKSN